MCTLRSRWRSRLLTGLILLVSGLEAMGQDPPTPAQDNPPESARCYVRNPSFSLPINIGDPLRSQIREIQLYWKNPATGGWSLLQTCPPSQTRFKFEADKEGEYLFTMTMVDLAGKSQPAEPEQSLLRMAVVVDLQSPTADVQFVQSASEGQIIQVGVRDPHLDQSKTQVCYQTKDRVWRTLDPLPQQSNRYCIPIQAATTGIIRVTASDKAGNTMRRDYDLGQSSAGQSIPETGSPLAKDGSTVELALGKAPAPWTSELYQRPSVASDMITGINPFEPDPAGKVSRIPGADASSKPSDIIVTPAVPPPFVEPRGVPLVPGPLPAEPIMPAAVKPTMPTPGPLTAPGQRLPSSPEKTSMADRKFGQVSVDRQLINHRQVLLAYQVEDVGTSGIGKVEVWLTRDMGKSWQKFCEDPQRKSPVAVELPGEGLYGITLVVSNGRGFGAAPPRPGNAPEAWVEVDLTRPAAELTGIRAGSGQDSGALFISWTAKDHNLPTDSVELFYSASREGNWQSIAKGLPNAGTHRWVPPSNFGPQAFIRLVVRDLAGNTTVIETPQSTAVDDLSRPRGRLVGILPYTPEIRLESKGN